MVITAAGRLADAKDADHLERVHGLLSARQQLSQMAEAADYNVDCSAVDYEL